MIDTNTYIYTFKFNLNVSVNCKPNPNFVDSDGYSCKGYERNRYCTSTGGYGEGWDRVIFGSFEDMANSDGETARVCPQCGCKGIKHDNYTPT